MNIKSYGTILTELCDNFDELISPEKIARDNSNVIYLIFKAVAKGLEIVNNVCVALSNKFIPERCTVSDLDSVGALVGTVRKQGNGSGLRITCFNSNDYDETLAQGSYTYTSDEGEAFTFTLLTPVEIESRKLKSFLAVTDDIGSFPVNAQTNITVTSTATIPTGMEWACLDNSNLLGGNAETDAEFRKRIVTDTTRQNALVELETAIKALPYILDCRVKFNSDVAPITYDGLTIPPYTMALYASGDIRNSLAEVVASYTLIPSVNSADSIETQYQNTVFTSGTYSVYFIPFKKKEYALDVTFRYNSIYTTEADCKTVISRALFTALNNDLHADLLRERDVYAVLNNIEVTGCEILGCNIIYDGEPVDYIEIPVSRVAELTDVTYTVESM